MATKQQLLNQAEVIRKETTPEANSAERVGGLLKNIIQSFPSQIVNPEEKDRVMTATPHTYDSEVYVDTNGRLWTHAQSIIDLDLVRGTGGTMPDLDTLLTPGKVYKYSGYSGRYPQKHTQEVYLSVYRDTFIVAGRMQYDYRMQVKQYFDKDKYITEYRVGEYSGNELNETCEWGEWTNTVVDTLVIGDIVSITESSTSEEIANALLPATYEEIAKAIQDKRTILINAENSSMTPVHYSYIENSSNQNNIGITFVKGGNIYTKVITYSTNDGYYCPISRVNVLDDINEKLVITIDNNLSQNTIIEEYNQFCSFNLNGFTIERFFELLSSGRTFNVQLKGKIVDEGVPLIGAIKVDPLYPVTAGKGSFWGKMKNEAGTEDIGYYLKDYEFKRISDSEYATISLFIKGHDSSDFEWANIVINNTYI